MWKTKTVPVSLSKSLLVAASLYICQVSTNAEKKLGNHQEIKSQSPCENQYKKFCLNGGESYYLVEEIFVGCIGTRLCGEN